MQLEIGNKAMLLPSGTEVKIVARHEDDPSKRTIETITLKQDVFVKVDEEGTYKVSSHVMSRYAGLVVLIAIVAGYCIGRFL